MALSTTIPVGLFSEFRVDALVLPEAIHELKLDFEDGDHVYNSPDLEFGVLKAVNNLPLMGRLTFRYTYDAADRVITLCGTDYPSLDGMALVTMPKDMEDHAHVERCVRFAEPREAADSLWNPHSELMSGAAEELKRIVRTANQTLIASLKAEAGLTIRVRTLPPRTSVSEYLKLRRIFKDGVPIAASNDAFVLPKLNAGDDDVEKNRYGSVWGGEVTFSQNENFANVIGSTNDPKIAGKSWYGLWVDYYGTPLPNCSSWQYNGFSCTPGPYLYGGHVVKGKVAKSMPKGSNSVYIMPICPAHNNDDSVYMAAVTNRKGVWLKDYLGP